MNFRQALFWDVNPAKIDPKKNAAYIIERILDFGNDNEVKWLFKNYSKAMLKKTVATSRSLTPRSKSLWTLVLKTK